MQWKTESTGNHGNKTKKMYMYLHVIPNIFILIHASTFMYHLSCKLLNFTHAIYIYLKILLRVNEIKRLHVLLHSQGHHLQTNSKSLDKLFQH